MKHARYGEKDGQRLNDRDTRYDDCRLAEWDLVSIPGHLDRRDLFQSHCPWSQVSESEGSFRSVCKWDRAKSWALCRSNEW